MAKQNAIVLLSGGLDSTVCLAWAEREFNVIRSLFFDYGQRAGHMERQASEVISKSFGVSFQCVKLPFLTRFLPGKMGSNSVQRLEGQATLDYQHIYDVWIPNRNAIFVSIGGMFIEALGGGVLVSGYNAQEGAEFPDNSVEFVNRVNAMFELSALAPVKLSCPLILLDKEGILRLGIALEAPLELIYSCYVGGEKMCGKCMSCMHFKSAFDKIASSDSQVGASEVVIQLKEKFEI